MLTSSRLVKIEGWLERVAEQQRVFLLVTHEQTKRRVYHLERSDTHRKMAEQIASTEPTTLQLKAATDGLVERFERMTIRVSALDKEWLRIQKMVEPDPKWWTNRG
jgi:K+/H+ antiporter YhaU regulatory subunit KhtT